MFTISRSAIDASLARRRTFCRTDRREALCSEVKRKRSRSESESEEGDKLHGADPKLGDLTMARVKRM